MLYQYQVRLRACSQKGKLEQIIGKKEENLRNKSSMLRGLLFVILAEYMQISGLFSSFKIVKITYEANNILSDSTMILRVFYNTKDIIPYL